MKLTPTISIIVPVYNVEKYLASCINSMLTQSFRNYEILLIDDGSTDNSGIICDEYKSIDDRIKVFHTINEGVSAARNLGIEKSTGEWLFFVDADDLVPNNALLELISSINESTDIVISNLKIETSENHTSIIVHNNTRFDAVDNNSELYILNNIKQFKMSLCGKLYKKELFEDIRLPEEVSYYEDYTTLWKIAKKTKYCSKINSIGYIVRYRSNSTSRRKIDIITFEKRINSLIYASKQIDFLFKDYKRINKYLTNFIISEGIGNKLLYNNNLHTNDKLVSSLTNQLWAQVKQYCDIPWYLKQLINIRIKTIICYRHYNFPLWLYYLIRLALKISYKS